MNIFQRNTYINHMYEFMRQPLKIFDAIDFFYSELDVEESKEFLSVTVKDVTQQIAKDHGFAMHNGCMPMRLSIVNINAVMKTITFNDNHIKWSKKGK